MENNEKLEGEKEVPVTPSVDTSETPEENPEQTPAE